MDKVTHITNTRKNIEDSAVSVVIRSVILSFNVFKLCIEVQGPELQCLLKVKEDLSIDILFVCLFLLLYVPCQQLWSLRDGQFT